MKISDHRNMELVYPVYHYHYPLYNKCHGELWSMVHDSYINFIKVFRSNFMRWYNLHVYELPMLWCQQVAYCWCNDPKIFAVGIHVIWNLCQPTMNHIFSSSINTDNVMQLWCSGTYTSRLIEGWGSWTTCQIELFVDSNTTRFDEMNWWIHQRFL